MSCAAGAAATWSQALPPCALGTWTFGAGSGASGDPPCAFSAAGAAARAAEPGNPAGPTAETEAGPPMRCASSGFPTGAPSARVRSRQHKGTARPAFAIFATSASIAATSAGNSSRGISSDWFPWSQPACFFPGPT